MMIGNDFTDKIWKKYNEYNSSKNKNDFFQKHQYKNTEYIRRVQTFLSLIAIIITTVGASYAGTIIYEIIQSNSQKNTIGEINYSEFYGDLTLEDGRFYKKIYSYEEYLSMKERFGNIIEITEEDFKDYFVLVIVLENYEEAGTYISNIGSDNDNIYIELKKYGENEKFDINNNVLSTKISKEQDRENVEIELIYDVIKPTSDKFNSLEELPMEYNEEQAIEDECFVIKNSQIISHNGNELEEFIRNAKNGENTFIRVVVCYEDGIVIRDIQYKNNVYYTGSDLRRFKKHTELDENYTNVIQYNTGYDINITGMKFSRDEEYNFYRYEILLDKDEKNPNDNNKFIICTINV